MLSSQIRVEKNHLKTKKNSAPILSLSTFILNGQYKIIFSTLRSKIWEVTFIEIFYFFFFNATEFSCVILSTLNLRYYGTWKFSQRDFPIKHTTRVRVTGYSFNPMYWKFSPNSSFKHSETHILIMFDTHTHNFCVGT